MQFNLSSRSSTDSVYICILMLPVFNIQNSPIPAHLEIKHTSRAMHFESVARVFRFSTLQNLIGISLFCTLIITNMTCYLYKEHSRDIENNNTWWLKTKGVSRNLVVSTGTYTFI